MEQVTEKRQQPERRLLDGLDYYKLTMGQVALERCPDTIVTFTMKNRAETPLSKYVDQQQLQERFEEIRQKGVSDEERNYLAQLTDSRGKPRFGTPYLDFLSSLHLTNVDVSVDPATNDLAIEATGPWANVSLWETVVMSEVNEAYYTNLLEAKGISQEAAWAEGNRRLDEKMTRLRNRPDIKFADFGTRRRFSAEWHAHVVGRLATELPDNLIGTSNPWLASTYNLTPIGTYAHEMPMVYAALADRTDAQPLDGHREMMNTWFDRYDEDLSIALTDTFTSDFFFSDMTPEQAEQWRGLRHDSGDPIQFGEQAIRFYEDLGINPLEKTIVFSDGLDLDTIEQLADHFTGKINVVFGWGTSLMNDLGFKANNFVMKATNVNGIDTVKLSDSVGKHTGPADQVERYIALKDARIAVNAALKEKVFVS